MRWNNPTDAERHFDDGGESGNRDANRSPATDLVTIYMLLSVIRPHPPARIGLCRPLYRLDNRCHEVVGVKVEIRQRRGIDKPDVDEAPPSGIRREENARSLDKRVAIATIATAKSASIEHINTRITVVVEAAYQEAEIVSRRRARLEVLDQANVAAQRWVGANDDPASSTDCNTSFKVARVDAVYYFDPAAGRCLDLPGSDVSSGEIALEPGFEDWLGGNGDDGWNGCGGQQSCRHGLEDNRLRAQMLAATLGRRQGCTHGRRRDFRRRLRIEARLRHRRCCRSRLGNQHDGGRRVFQEAGAGTTDA